MCTPHRNGNNKSNLGRQQLRLLDKKNEVRKI